MSSTNKFPSGLNNWLDSDKPERLDFTTDNEILDHNALWKDDYDADGAIIQTGGIKAYILNRIYPIGSIFLSVNETNPSVYFGGVWVAWGQGRVPVGVASSGTFSTVEKTGGVETQVLAINEIPAHNHGLTQGYNFAAGGTSACIGYSSSTGTSYCTSNTGSGAAHNNLQPYITCYMWKRTA